MSAQGVLAATLVEPGKYELREYPLPEPKSGCALVKMEMSGICGTDKHTFQGFVTQYGDRRLEFPIMADDQSPERNAYSGRVYDKGCPTLTAQQWKHVDNIVSDAEKVAQEFGLDLVFHPHVATYVESPEECERFYDATSHTKVGLCLDTGYSVYGHGDAVKEAEKYKDRLRFVHIKDRNLKVLEEARKNRWTFEEAIDHKVFTVIGKGNIDFPAFFRTLIKNGYSGWSVIEQDVKFGHTQIPPKHSVAASLRYLEGVMN